MTALDRDYRDNIFFLFIGRRFIDQNQLRGLFCEGIAQLGMRNSDIALPRCVRSEVTFGVLSYGHLNH